MLVKAREREKETKENNETRPKSLELGLAPESESGVSYIFSICSIHLPCEGATHSTELAASQVGSIYYFSTPS